jgi:hypothetical protein
VLPPEKQRSSTPLAIVDTAREPLLVLGRELRVLAASRSFYLTFKVTQDDRPCSSAPTLGPMIPVEHRRQVVSSIR